MNLTCEYCGKEFTRSEAEAKRSKQHFCSTDCYKKHKKGIPNLDRRLEQYAEPINEVVTISDHSRSVPIRKRDKVLIIGFAPDSRELAPYDDGSFDVWVLNELYVEMPRLEIRADAWFQLHGDEPPTIRDPQQVQRLAGMKCPVFMWRQHPQIPNSITYPLVDVLKHFDVFGEGMAPDQPRVRDRAYFSNSISWMQALAIMCEYKEIHIYGVNMAQDQEYKKQRPSCEFFLGWARGAGIKIYLPAQSDLLKCAYLYGYDDGSSLMKKLEARNKELNERLAHARQQKAQAQQQAAQAQRAEDQFIGALQDNEYMLQLGPIGVRDIVSS